ncbi:hypothetical protein [Microbulbifer halophilus]|uniref:hypothetical protein n=1 Tax=Microbulbifer halophilus TaxID=453963 RepID=UPI003612DE4B
MDALAPSDIPLRAERRENAAPKELITRCTADMGNPVLANSTIDQIYQLLTPILFRHSRKGNVPVDGAQIRTLSVQISAGHTKTHFCDKRKGGHGRPFFSV